MKPETKPGADRSIEALAERTLANPKANGAARRLAMAYLALARETSAPSSVEPDQSVVAPPFVELP